MHGGNSEPVLPSHAFCRELTGRLVSAGAHSKSSSPPRRSPGCSTEPSATCQTAPLARLSPPWPARCCVSAYHVPDIQPCVSQRLPQDTTSHQRLGSSSLNCSLSLCFKAPVAGFQAANPSVKSGMPFIQSFSGPGGPHRLGAQPCTPPCHTLLWCGKEDTQ